MREIKFRAWSSKSGMWDWDKLCNYNGGHPLACLYSHQDGSWVAMQYTGLKDSKGTDVYEGDIITNPMRNGGKPHPIEWDNDQSAWVGVYGLRYLLGQEIGDNHIEVVGNIYENSELLEVSK